VTLAGAGFTSGSQAACPSLVATTYVDAGTLTAAIPADVTGPAGGSVVVNVFVQNDDGTVSAALPFTVLFPATLLQTWTTIDAVCGEVSGFKRGGSVSDDQINIWMRSIAQTIAAVMLKRGLPLNPALWPAPDPTASPSPAELLEMINRLGAAARLAATIGAQFVAGGGEWGVAKGLRTAFDDEIVTLREGEYDKVFLAAASTVEPGPLLGAGPAWSEPAFTKGRVF
jgi:hypothetical protein